MYGKDDKRRLYWLINEFLRGKIPASIFCDEFYYSYDLEIPKNVFSDIEYRAFSELNETLSRFSAYESDHLLDPKAFANEKELMEKIKDTKEKLNATWGIIS